MGKSSITVLKKYVGTGSDADIDASLFNITKQWVAASAGWLAWKTKAHAQVILIFCMLLCFHNDTLTQTTGHFCRLWQWQTSTHTNGRKHQYCGDSPSVWCFILHMMKLYIQFGEHELDIFLDKIKF